MDVHHIDVISVQSVCYHDKVSTHVSYVCGLWLTEDVVRNELHCIIMFSTQQTQ